MKRTVLSTLLLVITAFGLMVTAVGCAGGAVDFNTWADSYSGSGTLDNSKTGTLNLTSDANGIVTGTLTVTGADGTDTDFKFTAGTYNLVGSITSTGGNFEVSGNVPNNGDFFVRGNFPTNGSTKTYTIFTATSEAFPESVNYTGTLSEN